MTSQPNHELFTSAISAWKPEPNLTLAEWAEKHIYLPSGKLKLFPFQRDMINSIGEYEEIVMMTGARIGKTMISSIVAAYYLSARPLRVGFIQPTSDDATSFSAESLMPMLESTEPVAELLKTASRQTMTHIEAGGGSLKLLSANTPRHFRRIDLDVTVADESSSYPGTDEGDILSLAKKRSMNSFARKFITTSTPTSKESSIVKAFTESDARYLWVPCPHCGAFQVLEIKNMVIGDKPAVNFTSKEARQLAEEDPDFVVTYRCEHCAEHIHREQHLTPMLERGEFRASNPSNRVAGFAVWAAYSPFPNADWTKLVREEFFPALNDPLRMRTFENTILGEPYEDSIADINVADLLERCVGRWTKDMLHPACLVLYCGCDVQGDRIESCIVGMSEDHQYFLVDHTVLRGRPTEPDVWKLLDQYRGQRFQHPLGGKIEITCTSVDSGYLTSIVSEYASTRPDVFAVKGRAGAHKAMEISRAKLHKDGAKLHLVGVDTVKDALFLNLSQTDIEKPGFWHLSEQHAGNEELFEGLTAEHKVIRISAGRPVTQYVQKTGRVSEVLDGCVYALAASTQFSPNWKTIREELDITRGEDPGSDDDGWASIGEMLGKLM